MDTNDYDVEYYDMRGLGVATDAYAGDSRLIDVANDVRSQIASNDCFAFAYITWGEGTYLVERERWHSI